MTSISTEAASRRESARSSDGTFGHQHHTEASVGLSATPASASFTSHDQFENLGTPERMDLVEAWAQTHVPEKTCLYYPDQHDRLNPVQIGLHLSGDTDRLREHVEEDLSESRYDAAEVEAREAFGRMDHVTDVEWEDLSMDEQQAFTDTVYERDASDPVAGLTRGTPPQLMRTTMGCAGETELEVNHPAYQVRLAARRQHISTTLAAHGMTSEQVQANAEAIEDMIHEGPEHWHEGVDLDIIFQDDIDDYAPQPKATSFTFNDPHVLLIDRWSGSGWDAQLSGSLTKTLPENQPGESLETADRFFLDSGGERGGYGWDETAGVVHSAYRAEVTQS